MQIVRAFGIDALMQDKVFPVLFGDEGMPAVGAAQLRGREAVILL